jgi:hypothetical protein
MFSVLDMDLTTKGINNRNITLYMLKDGISTSRKFTKIRS